jgi:hypothetical protein
VVLPSGTGHGAALLSAGIARTSAGEKARPPTVPARGTKPEAAGVESLPHAVTNAAATTRSRRSRLRMSDLLA